MIECKFRILDEKQYRGEMGNITLDSFIFDSNDFTLYDYLIDNDCDNNDYDFDEKKNCILVTKDDEFVDYYDCIKYKEIYKKDYKLNIDCESIEITYNKKEAKDKGINVCKYKDNDNIFYLAYSGKLGTDKELYFDTFNKMQKYMNTHTPEMIKIYRDNFSKYKFGFSSLGYDYVCYKYDENNEKYIQMKNKKIIKSKIIILDR